jgi:hypothetical protein
MSEKLVAASSNLLSGHDLSSLHSAWNKRPVASNDRASSGRLSKRALGISIASCAIVAVTCNQTRGYVSRICKHKSAMRHKAVLASSHRPLPHIAPAPNLGSVQPTAL